MSTVEERVIASRNHYSHPSFLFGDWQPLGQQFPILNDYIASCVLTFIFASTFYLAASSISYFVFFVWGRKTFTPRREQLLCDKQQIQHDIKWSFLNIIGQIPLINLVKLGYPYFSKAQYSLTWTPMLPIYLCLHILFDEFFTYWIHRILHHPKIYRKLHYIHHQSKAITPFCGFAFHPLDAFLQALPVFTTCYLIPLPIDIVLVHGMITSIWAISIHDNVNLIPFKGILYAGSHSIHHFPWGENYNYGKITSVCDRLYGTYCDPQSITGYGYEIGEFSNQIFNNLNQLYQKMVPDLGKEVVMKQARRFAKVIKKSD